MGDCPRRAPGRRAARHAIRSGGRGDVLSETTAPNRDPAWLDAARDRLDAIITAGARGQRRAALGHAAAGHAERAEEPTACTRYPTGVAGYGIVLLRYAAPADGRPWGWRLADDPF